MAYLRTRGISTWSWSCATVGTSSRPCCSRAARCQRNGFALRCHLMSTMAKCLNMCCIYCISLAIPADAGALAAVACAPACPLHPAPRHQAREHLPDGRPAVQARRLRARHQHGRGAALHPQRHLGLHGARGSQSLKSERLICRGPIPYINHTGPGISD